MPISAADWYDTDPDSSSLYQGDIVTNVPVTFMPPAGDGPWVILRPSSPVTREDALAGNIPKFFRPHVEKTLEDAWERGQELVLAKGIATKVMVVTQTCDLERRKFIQVAPVYEARILGAKKLASLEANEINYMFYLPDDPPSLTEKYFADLSQITAVHRSYFRGRERLIKRLTANATVKLQQHLANFHGRPFGFNTCDDVPQTAEYVCANCFFSAAVVQKQHISNGQRFPACPNCGVDVLWVKAR